MDSRIAKATDTDQLLSRAYRQLKGAGSVSLFIGYGIRLRDLLPHRPEVCYPGNGWALRDTQRVELEISAGDRLPCQVHRFTRGGLSSESMVVLNYYIVDGRYCADVTLLRSMSWKRDGSSHYAAQVQVASAGGDLAVAWVEDFAAACAAPTRALFEDALAAHPDSGQTN